MFAPHQMETNHLALVANRRRKATSRSTPNLECQQLKKRQRSSPQEESNMPLQKRRNSCFSFFACKTSTAEDDHNDEVRLFEQELPGGMMFDHILRKPLHKETKRSVRFVRTTVTAEIPSEVYDDEIDHLWYSSNELAQIEDRNMETVRLIKSGVRFSDDNTEHCKRGLESYTENNSLTASRSKEATIDQVLDRQVELWSTGTDDQERLLSETYCVYSCQHGFNALVRALNDWRAAQGTGSTINFINEIARISAAAAGSQRNALNLRGAITVTHL